MTDTDYPYKEKGYGLMGAVFEVHKTLGDGLLEEIYQESLEIELAFRRIPFSSKQQLILFYKETQLSKMYVPDLVVSEGILVELKAVKELLPEHEAQLLNYMRIARRPVGYLINFAPMKEVQWKRFALRENLNKQNR